MKKQLFFYLFLLQTILAHAQSFSVHGKVTDESGAPLPGSTVVVAGTTRGVATDFNGDYRITVKNGEILEYSFVGMQKETVQVTDQQEINVVLKESRVNLDEVEVVAYGVQKKVTVTGSISSIGTEELAKLPTISVANSLAGRVTGLSTVQYSGQPGADDPMIAVRGVSTLNGTSPLMLVDGVERSFTQLDPNEIENITILKDASATAVYGVRGANGVIIVTTKRGTEGAPKISFSTSVGAQQPTRLLDFADSYTYALMYNEAQTNDGVTPDNLRFNPTALEAFRTNSSPILYPNTNWMDKLIKPASLQTTNNINISGGTKTVKYFISLGYTKQNGLFNTFNSQYDNNFSYDRYNYRTNLDIDVTKSTQLGLTIGGRTGIQNEPNSKDGMNFLFRDIYWAVPFSGPGIVDGKYVINNNEQYIPGQKKDGLDPFYGLGYNNQVNNTLNLDIQLNQKLDFILKGLNFRIKYANNSSYNHTKNRNSSVASYIPYYLTDVDPGAAGDSTIVYKKSGSDGVLGYWESRSKARNWYAETALSYAGKFGPHNVGALLLYNESKNFYPTTITDIPRGLVGLAGRVTYDYKTRYMVEVNLGYNGSENFAIGRRFGFFPAVSLGWIISDENFVKNNVSFLDYMKLRFSYGEVGNDQFGGSRFLYVPGTYYLNRGSYSFGTDNPANQIAAAEGSIGNPFVTWETALKQNYGVDIKLFKGKLALNMDYFYEHRKDILWSRSTVPSILAISLPAENIGEVKNEGYEISARWDQNISNLRFWVSPNVSYAHNTILYKDEIPQPYPYLYETGHPLGQPFGYVFDRFWTEADLQPGANVPDHKYAAKPGDMMYKDLNKDGVIDSYDQMAIGYPDLPEYTMGMNAGFTYKNIDFYMAWAGATHTSRVLDETYKVAFGSTHDRSLLQYMADGRWTPENAAGATYPRMSISGSVNNSKPSDFWVRDASYIRLKTVEVGYSFNIPALKNIGILNMRAFVNAYNLLTFSKLKITDPESRTGSNSVYPLIKVYNAGLKFNL